MIKNLLITGIAFLGMNSYAQTTLFQTANDYSAWTFVDADGDTRNWTVEDGTTYGPPFDVQGNMLTSFSTSQVDGPFTPDNWAITELPDLAGFFDLTLSWKRAFGSFVNPADKYSVYVVSVSNPVNLISALSTATPLFEEVGADAFQFQMQTIDISSFDGMSNLYIAFRHHDCNGQGFVVLDDFEVVGYPLGASTSSLSTNATVYPNPVVNELKIKSSEMVLTVKIVDLNGKLILTKENLEDTYSMDLDASDLNHGVYLLEIVTSKGSFYSKISK